MYSKDLERLVRTFIGQKVDREYIRHYLMETYQMDAKSTDEIIAKVAPGGMAGGTSGGKPTKPEDGGGIKRQRFY